MSIIIDDPDLCGAVARNWILQKKPSPDEVNSFSFYNNLSGTQTDGIRRYFKHWYGVAMLASCQSCSKEITERFNANCTTLQHKDVLLRRQVKVAHGDDFYRHLSVTVSTCRPGEHLVCSVNDLKKSGKWLPKTLCYDVPFVVDSAFSDICIHIVS